MGWKKGYWFNFVPRLARQSQTEAMWSEEDRSCTAAARRALGGVKPIAEINLEVIFMGVELECHKSHSSGTHAPDCCGHVKKKSKFQKIMDIADKVSAVALGIFAAYINWKLFVPFFFLGICIGSYTYLQNKKSNQHPHSGTTCAQGFLEKLTGVQLPAPVSLAANIAVTVAHIDHHSNVFVPIVGVSLGAWAGDLTCHYGAIACKKFKHCHRAPVAA